MSSSIEEYFQPPEWATKEEVIKAAQHYINYWKIEAKQRNQQWLNALEENARLKAELERLRKAGDAMANWFRPVAGVESLPAHIVYDAWNAAKEGKQP